MQRRGCSPPTGRVYTGALVRIQFCPKFSPAPIIEGPLGAGPCGCSKELLLGPALVPTTELHTEKNAQGWGGRLVTAPLWPDLHLNVCVCVLQSFPDDPLFLGSKPAPVSDAPEKPAPTGPLPCVNGGTCPGGCFLFLSPPLSIREQERGPTRCLEGGRPQEWVDCKLFIHSNQTHYLWRIHMPFKVLTWEHQQ